MSVRNAVKNKVLLVDDEEALVESHARHLARAGFEVEVSSSAREALRRLQTTSFDAVVTDIMMPEMDGLSMVRKVREHDLDLPVIFITGVPSVETASRAIEYGAFRYLVKPLKSEDLVRNVQRATQLYRLGKAKREALAALGAAPGEAGDRAGMEASFERALSTLWIAFQPIVRASDRGLFGYEALLRTDEPALPHPGAVLDVAQRLGRLHDLGRAIRERAVAALANREGEWHLFINLHPQDLLDEALYELVDFQKDLAQKIVLEVTERASLDEVDDARNRVASLRDSGCRIAVDDLGAGYAGLASFVQLEPDVVKLDMSLVRGVDASATKQRLVRALTDVCREMGLSIVAEGIETQAERDTVIALGCDLLQGYLFGKPSRTLAEPRWG